MLALTQPADAKIVYTPTHKLIEGRRGILNIDLNHDGIVDFQLQINSGSGGVWLAAYAYASGGYVWESNAGAAAFPAGVRIGERGVSGRPLKGGAFMEGAGCPAFMEDIGRGGTSCGPAGNWLDVRHRYLGLTFDIKGKTHYGWARLNTSISEENDVHALLTGYAYETVPNKPIITGKTKGTDVITVQPASLAQLAQGAHGLAERGSEVAERNLP